LPLNAIFYDDRRGLIAGTLYVHKL
jgi:hypothetical protein